LKRVARARQQVLLRSPTLKSYISFASTRAFGRFVASTEIPWITPAGGPLSIKSVRYLTNIGWVYCRSRSSSSRAIMRSTSHPLPQVAVEPLTGRALFASEDTGTLRRRMTAPTKN